MHIFNLSFESGVFPGAMKIAKVIPLFKGGDAEDFSNYRPVSLLSQFSKILEKLYNNRLLSLMNVNNVLFSGQFGFRENHSTALALTEMVEVITDAMDRGNYSIGVFVDLKKAFDTIDHKILIRKLAYYGIRGVASEWLCSYLTNRKQYVNYNNMNSDFLNIRCGVPQGSILGPTLFLLYVNDLGNVSNVLKTILFADDTNIFYSSDSIRELQSTVNEELKKLHLWFKVNN